MNLRTFTGMDARRFDTRTFDINRPEVERLCAIFHTGKLLNWIPEKDLRLSHSNFTVYAQCARGQYIFKFQPTTDKGSPRIEKAIQTEWLLNRLLISRKIAVPAMFQANDFRPYALSDQYFTTCYTYLNGYPAYQSKLMPRQVTKINNALFLLNQALGTTPAIVTLLKTEPLIKKLRPLIGSAHTCPPVQEALKAFKRAYSSTPQLFTTRPIHANLSLANIFFCHSQAYILDIGHIQADQELSGLATLITSCIFLKKPSTVIHGLVQGYFRKHRLKKEKLAVLNVLVQLDLAKEYIKLNTRGEERARQLPTNRLQKEYTYHLGKRLEMLRRLLEKKNGGQERLITKLF